MRKMKMTTKNNEENKLSPMDKQFVPLSSEVDPKDAASKARQAAFKHSVSVKNKPVRR